MGYAPDRDNNLIEKSGADFTFAVDICRTVKGDFKHLDCRLIFHFVDLSSRGFPRVIEFKKCKALSVEYVRACEECAQSVWVTIKTMLNSIQNQVSLVDPTEILKKENGSDVG